MQGSLADIEAEIKNILTRFLKDPPPLSGATDLIADLDLESVQVMEFVMEVEDHFDIDIPLNVLSETRTMDDLVGVVEGRLNRSAKA